ncbi:MAG: PilN domain-containing protein [Gammaproteobacteria bacterium]|nr:PilN domain-containing protein [Gammaproteobacteria bacterium]
MYQYVNLYQPVFRQQPKLLSANTLLIIVAVVAAFFTAGYFNARSNTQHLSRTSAELGLNYSQLLVQIESFENLAKESYDSTPSSTLDLEDQIENRKALLERVDILFQQAQFTFGDVFESLAESTTEGLWLTGVDLDREGNIEISGTTLDPKLVPRYLETVSQYEALAELNQGSVSLTRQSESRPEIDFQLSYQTVQEIQ